MAEVSGGELVVRTLMREGVRTVYLLYGGQMQTICESIRAHGLDFVYTRHEVAAGYAAQGMARAAGDIGVALVSAGPAFTNILTSIAAAQADRTPVVYICASSPQAQAQLNGFMTSFDAATVARPLTKWAHCVTRADSIPRMLSHAIRVARSDPPGPVLLDIPADVAFARVDENAAPLPAPIAPRSGTPPQTLIERTVAMLKDARQPLILVGEGASGREVAPLLRALVAITGIPVFSGYNGIGLLPSEDPRYGGSLWKLRADQSAGLIPDVLLALGTRFGFMTGGAHGLIPAAAAVIQVDIDAAELGRVRDVDLGIAAAAEATLEALLTEARRHDWPDRTGWVDRLSEARARREHERDAEAEAAVPPEGTIHPLAAARAIVAAAGDATYVLDGADSHMWLAEAMRQAEPGRVFAQGSAFGCIGYGLGFAIGVQNARPDERVICVIGDGSVGFTLAELHTFALHDLPIIVIVMNNREWGATSLLQESTVFGTHNRKFAMDLKGAAYDGVGAALGCHAEHVIRLDQLAPAIGRALASGRPACINVEISLDTGAPDSRTLAALAH